MSYDVNIIGAPKSAGKVLNQLGKVKQALATAVAEGKAFKKITSAPTTGSQVVEIGINLKPDEQLPISPENDSTQNLDNHKAGNAQFKALLKYTESNGKTGLQADEETFELGQTGQADTMEKTIVAKWANRGAYRIDASGSEGQAKGTYSAFSTTQAAFKETIQRRYNLNKSEAVNAQELQNIKYLAQDISMMNIPESTDNPAAADSKPAETKPAAKSAK
jgi:hypothetical protein